MSCERAVAIQERVFGPVHPRVASAVNDLGAVALRRGSSMKPKRRSGGWARSTERCTESKHYLLGIAISNLASVYSARKTDEAETFYREAIAIYERPRVPST